MTETRKKRLPQGWAALKRSLGKDILTYSDKEIDKLIRAAGGDPAAIDRRSREQARKIWGKWRGRP